MSNISILQYLILLTHSWNHSFYFLKLISSHSHKSLFVPTVTILCWWKTARCELNDVHWIIMHFFDGIKYDLWRVLKETFEFNPQTKRNLLKETATVSITFHSFIVWLSSIDKNKSRFDLNDMSTENTQQRVWLFCGWHFHSDLLDCVTWFGTDLLSHFFPALLFHSHETYFYSSFSMSLFTKYNWLSICWQSWNIKIRFN